MCKLIPDKLPKIMQPLLRQYMQYIVNYNELHTFNFIKGTTLANDKIKIVKILTIRNYSIS